MVVLEMKDPLPLGRLAVYPAAKWVPSINKAVLRAFALDAATALEYPLGD